MKLLGKIKGPARHGIPWTGFFPFCVCLTVFFVSASVSIAQQAQDSADSPPNPFRLGEKELQSGNPLAGYVRLLELEGSDSKILENPLWFFEVDEDEIQGIEVNHLSTVIRFNRVEGDVWMFRDPRDVPVDYSRFGGVIPIAPSKFAIKQRGR